MRQIWKKLTLFLTSFSFLDNFSIVETEGDGEMEIFIDCRIYWTGKTIIESYLPILLFKLLWGGILSGSDG